LGLFLAPFLGVFNLWQAAQSFGMLEQLRPLQAGFIVVETLANALLQIAAPIHLLTQMLPKKAGFPSLYKAFLIVGLLWVVFDLMLAYVLFQEVFRSGQVEFWDRENARALAQAIIGVAIWVPYMENSVRVKNTFVR
jgi:hypothetical protein